MFQAENLFEGYDDSAFELHAAIEETNDLDNPTLAFPHRLGPHSATTTARWHSGYADPGGGHHRGGGNKGGSASDEPPKPKTAEAVVLDPTAYEAAWTQCHLNVDLMRRLSCYERLHDDQQAALKAHGPLPAFNPPFARNRRSRGRACRIAVRRRSRPGRISDRAAAAVPADSCSSASSARPSAGRAAGSSRWRSRGPDAAPDTSPPSPADSRGRRSGAGPRCRPAPTCRAARAPLSSPARRRCAAGRSCCSPGRPARSRAPLRRWR